MKDGTLTRQGRVVYNRKTHRFTPVDIERIVQKARLEVKNTPKHERAMKNAFGYLLLLLNRWGWFDEEIIDRLLNFIESNTPLEIKDPWWLSVIWEATDYFLEKTGVSVVFDRIKEATGIDILQGAKDFGKSKIADDIAKILDI